MFNLCIWRHIPYIETWFAYFQIRKLRDRNYNVLYLHLRSLSFQTGVHRRNRLKVQVGYSLHVKYTWICVIMPISMHNCRSTRQQRLHKELFTRNRSDNESLSFRSITKIAAIHNPHTTQKMTDKNRSCAGLWTITR